MADVCNIPEKTVGPYNQTLFLGCSIKDFNCNLGWGAEQSTLSVSLVEDSCRHPQSSVQSSRVDVPIEAITAQIQDTPSQALYGIGDRPNSTFNPPIDRSKTLYRNLAENIKKDESDRDSQNIKLPSDLKDWGKKTFGVYENTSKFYTDGDPGFLALAGNKFVGNDPGYDILGTPVVFRFYGFSFGGLISSWKQNSSKTFDVEIKSFSSLLNGCQLIIGKYAGTMCGIAPGSSLAMPMPYGVDTTTTATSFAFNDHNANINQGNIPNVFNIYGYLEYLGYKNKIFGNAGVNEDGMRAQLIYDTLINMIGTPNNINNIEIARFAPYNSILTRSIRLNDGREVDPLAARYDVLNLTDMGICPNFMAPDRYRRCRLLLDISEVPRPPKWLRLAGPVISIMQFITEICDGSGHDFFVDFLPPPASSVYSGIIKIRTVSRRKQPRKNQIDALIADAANRIGVSSFSKGREFTDSNVRSMYVGGNQKRLLQIKSTRLAFKQNSLIYDPWANNGSGHWVDYGQSIQSLGSLPNQLRMPNLASTRRYSVMQIGGAAVTSESNNFNNQNAYFTTGGNSRPIRQGNYNVAVNLSNGAMFEEMASASLGGDFPDPRDEVDITDMLGTSNVALYQDAICPFFGTGYGGLIRKVFFDTNMGQMQIIFYVKDIQDLTSLPFSMYNPFPDANEASGIQRSNIAMAPIFLVLENEIRAAGAGFASWLNYCFGNIFTTDISQLIYKGFRDKYGFSGASVNIREDFLTGLAAIIAKANNKNLIVNNRPMQVSLDDLNPYIRTLYHDLEKIHQFFANIANNYYGKQYMVRTPAFAYYTDLSYAYDNNNNRIILGLDENNNPIYAVEGTGKQYTNYSLSSDGAWEEPGNWIDDTMVIGGLRASALADESGKIPCLLGFNASVEKDYSKLWNWTQNLYYASLRRFNDRPNSHTVLDYEFIMERMLNDPILNGNHYYASINHELSPDEYLVIPYAAGAVDWQTAHGESIPSNRKYKLYAKASPSESIEFLGPYNFGPRAILTLPSPIYVGQSKNSTDNNLSFVMNQDAFIFLLKGPRLPSLVQSVPPSEPFATLGSVRARTINRGFSPNPLGLYDICSIGRNVAYNNMDQTDRDSQPTIIQKAAIPMFCALPIEYNTHVYGPWINHPGLIRNNIFPDSINQILDVENLIGGVKVQIDSNLVPWAYGGMTQLDEAVMLKIADDVNYQQFLENGTVQVPGFDNFSLGTIIRYFGGLFDGPIINSIQVQIGENGITTTYNFRTYTRKLGLFNKENADRIKAIGQEALKRNKEISNRILKLASKIGIGLA